MKRNLRKEKEPSTSTMKSERNRRGKMTEFYAVLQSMVPNLFPKATRSRIVDETIVDETIGHIKSLEEVVSELESQRMPEGLQTQDSYVTVTLSDKTAFFGLRILSRPGLCTLVMGVFESHRVEVLNTTVTSRGKFSDFTVVALVAEEGVAEKIESELMTI